MMAATRDAPSLDWQSANQLEAFNIFEQRMTLYFQTRKITEATEKVAHILLQLGEEGLRRYNSLTLTNEEQRNPAVILQKLKAQLEPAENFRVSRLRLMGFRQKEKENIDSFVT